MKIHTHPHRHSDAFDHDHVEEPFHRHDHVDRMVSRDRDRLIDDLRRNEGFTWGEVADHLIALGWTWYAPEYLLTRQQHEQALREERERIMEVIANVPITITFKEPVTEIDVYRYHADIITAIRRSTP